jgi:hypothetical protein
MSFSMTTEAMRRREKTVTRRLGWWDLRPGTILQAVEKAQGLRKGERVKPICLVRVVRVEVQELYKVEDLGHAEMVREGFPDLTPWQFIVMFAKANNLGESAGFAAVNRIEFEYLDGPA